MENINKKMTNNINVKLILVLGLLLISLNVLAEKVTTYHYADLYGSPVAATDSSGTLIWTERYTAYGKRFSNQSLPDGDNISFTGYAEDSDAGLSYAGARWYNPDLGRFTGMDPAGVSPTDTRLFNRYAYANNNPYKYVDPDGRVPVLAVAVFVVRELASAAFELVTGIPTFSLKNTGEYAYGKARTLSRKARANDAASRWGLNLDDISISDGGTAMAKIKFAATLDPKDMKQIKDVLRSRGATQFLLETGTISNPKLNKFLLRRLRDGKPFNGAEVGLNYPKPGFVFYYDLSKK